MAGEIEGLVGALRRRRRLNDGLRRTENPEEREAIRSRLQAVQVQIDEAHEALKAAYRAGDPEAKEFFKLLGATIHD